MRKSFSFIARIVAIVFVIPALCVVAVVVGPVAFNVLSVAVIVAILVALVRWVATVNNNF